MKIQVIVGTTRQNRFSEKAASWIYKEAKKKEEIEVELVDLRDYPLPFFNEPVSPATMEKMKKDYSDEVAKKWAQKVAEADGYIIVTGEYNHGYPAVLKNALDYVYSEWNKKPVGFVSYGSTGGSRSVEQLREVVVELQMVPIRNAIHIPSPVYMAVINHEKEGTSSNPFEPLNDPKNAFLDQLIWWTKVLLSARKSN